MEKIASFTIDHLKLRPGLYVSRKDVRDNVTVTTFDIRITSPNIEPVIDNGSLHSIEHLAATYLRNSARKEDIVYFGPMGCRTGCYLLLFGNLESEDVYSLVIDMCDFIIEYQEKYREPVPGNAVTTWNRIFKWLNSILKSIKRNWKHIKGLNTKIKDLRSFIL